MPEMNDPSPAADDRRQDEPDKARSGSRPSGLWKPPALELLQALLPQYEFLGLLGRGGMGAWEPGKSQGESEPGDVSKRRQAAALQGGAARKTWMLPVVLGGVTVIGVIPAACPRAIPAQHPRKQFSLISTP